MRRFSSSRASTVSPTALSPVISNRAVSASPIFILAILALAILSTPLPALSQRVDAALLRPQATPAPSNIVIGFVGGFVSHDNLHHAPVQLARQIRRTVPADTYVEVFENRRRKLAYQTVIRLLDSNHDGILSIQEKTAARIILFGHSWGAAAAVLLARDLRREGVPVSLTVQVDSVAKIWQNDSVIPDNVANAVNFYQPHGVIHGRARITAADPARTEILGNYRMDYRRNPVSCTDAPRWERLFAPGHMQSECDPRLWSQVENLVRQQLSSQKTLPQTTTAAASAAILPQP